MQGQTSQSILDAIGNTPMVRLGRIGAGLQCNLLAKLELHNPGGSGKIRSALAMVAEAERTGRLRAGGTLIEASSGNAGIALAIVAAVRGYRCICVTTDRQSPEKIATLKAFGAEVIVCPAAVRPEDPRSHHSVAWRLAEEIPGSWFAHQHGNPANPDAHRTGTGTEIWKQTAGRVTHVFCGLGTGGTATGIARALHEHDPAIQVIGVEPAGGLYGEFKRGNPVPRDRIPTHLTEGIGEDMLPEVLDLEELAEVIAVPDRDALLTTRRLARTEGILCGGSSGAVVAAALRWCQSHRPGPDTTIVCVLHDTGTRYLSRIFNDEWMKENRFVEERGGQTAGELCARKRAEPDAIPGLISVSPHSLLLEVLELLRQHEVSQIPVVEQGRVIGTVKEDRVVHLLIRDPEAKGRPARDVMDPPLPEVEPGASIETVSDLLREQPAVLVRTRDGLDILTKADLVRMIARWAT
ncbi:MAG: cystathionine beta-synthase [Planctomycetota bacterium]|nr:MAG: cystathionine beta-synthase [Planctomycetota bacterium]